MRMVVDSNQLQSDALRAYLTDSRKNFAVLTDYAAMEAYKGDTLASIYKSMAILTRFPDQVIVLKNTCFVCGLDGRGSGLQRRFIDEEQTKGFAAYARDLRVARAGNPSLQRQLLENGKEATAHLDRMLQDAELMGGAFDELAQDYSKDERQLIRDGGPYTTRIADKIVSTVIHVAGPIFRDHPNVKQSPGSDELPNTLIFRAALCQYLLALDWGVAGGVKQARAITLRNDMVDVYFAAYGTFFDGLLTADAKLTRLHREARRLLSGIFNCHMHSGIP